MVYAATGSGLFKTTDGGQSWNLSLEFITSSTAALIQDPANPNTVYFTAPSFPAGLHRTTDAGATWTLFPGVFGTNVTGQALAADAATGALYAGANNGGVFKSVDQGQSWTPANAGLPSIVWTLAAAETAPFTLYAGTSSGVFRTTDGAATWQPRSTGLPAGVVLHLVAHPTDPMTAYAAVANAGVYKTTNGGLSWVRTSSDPTGNFTDFDIDPSNPNVLYLASQSLGIGRSVDGGVTWQWLTAGLPNRDARAIGVGPNSGLYVSVNGAGVWKLQTAANDVPVAQGQSVGTAEDTPVSLTLTATDPDAEPLTFSIAATPAHGTLSVSGASVIYTPAPNYNGPDNFMFKANDGRADSNVAMVSITVTPVNDAPMASDDSLSTNEDTPLTIPAVALLGNDVDLDNSSLTVAIETGPSMGTLAANPDGSLTFTPPPNVFGSATFTYRASDGSLSSNLATVTITVLPVNDAPLALNGALTIDEDTAGSGAVAATDIDTPLLTFTVFSNGAKGSVAIGVPSSGAFTYTPNANENGADSFVIAVSDGQFTVHATVAVTITAVNDAPVAIDGTLSTNEDVPVTGTLTASDVDSSSLTFSIVGNASKGTVVITDAATGAYTYTPLANANGPDTFTFRASDGSLQSNVAIIQVALAPVNDAPVAQPIALAAAKQTATAGQLIATDVDPDTLSFALVQTPAQGTVTVAANGSFVYTSSSSASGVDTFTFKANDGSADSAVATASVTILSPSGAPVAFDATLAATEDMLASGALTSAAQSGRVLTYSINASPTKGTVVITNAATGAFSYTPNANENGDDSFTFRVNDGVQLSNLATISVAIAPVNDAPMAIAGSLAVTEDRAETGILIGTDVDGQALTFEIVGTPSQGTVEITNPATGRYTYTPNANAFGADTFAFRVSDGATTSGVTSVAVVISNVNDGPVANDVSFTTSVDTPLAATLPAADPDNDPLTFEIRRAPRRGTLTIVNAATGAFIYTPDASFSGTDTFTFRVGDGTRNSLVATVTITVRPN